MKPPTTVSELDHFMGMVNQLIMHCHMDWKQYCCRRLSLSGNPFCIMMNKERRYAQIEKMALAIMWACKQFSDYILGNSITIETDHKPLVPLLGRKAWTAHEFSDSASLMT